MIAVGVVVTGSGPHAGDAHARRTGLDPAAVAQAHADLVFLLIGLTVALSWRCAAVARRRAAVPGRARAARRSSWARALIGFVQYFTHLPVVLVGVHLLGAAPGLGRHPRRAVRPSPCAPADQTVRARARRPRTPALVADQSRAMIASASRSAAPGD